MKRGIHRAHPFIEQVVDTDKIQKPEEKLALYVFIQALKDIKKGRKLALKYGSMDKVYEEAERLTGEGNRTKRQYLFDACLNYQDAKRYLEDQPRYSTGEAYLWHDWIGIDHINIEEGEFAERSMNVPLRTIRAQSEAGSHMNLPQPE